MPNLDKVFGAQSRTSEHRIDRPHVQLPQRVFDQRRWACSVHEKIRVQINAHDHRFLAWNTSDRTLNSHFQPWGPCMLDWIQVGGGVHRSRLVGPTLVDPCARLRGTGPLARGPQWTRRTRPGAPEGHGSTSVGPTVDPYEPPPPHEFTQS